MKSRELVEKYGVEPIGFSGGLTKALTGEHLSIVNKSIKIDSLDEFKGKEIEIIENIDIKKPVEKESVVMSKVGSGISISYKSEPELISIVDGPGLEFSNYVKLYSMFISTSVDGKKVFIYRVTPDSIKK